jgi:hypothetical protein
MIYLKRRRGKARQGEDENRESKNKRRKEGISYVNDISGLTAICLQQLSCFNCFVLCLKASMR